MPTLSADQSNGIVGNYDAHFLLVVAGMKVVIRAKTSRHGVQWLLTAGVIGCVLVLLLALQSQPVNHWQWWLLLMVGYFAWLGWIKLRQPYFNLLLDGHGFHYFHRFGSWFCPASNINRIDIAQLTTVNGPLALPYIAITLKSLGAFLPGLSPRLAARMLTEQRELVVAAIRQQQVEEQAGVEAMFCQEPWSVGTQTFTGLQAMFAHRAQLLHASFGAHLFIPVADLDRSAEDFVGIAAKWLAEQRTMRW